MTHDPIQPAAAVAAVAADTKLPAVQGAISLPVKKGDDFIGEFESMDLTELKDKQFIVAVSAGDRDKGTILPTTMKGPYDFLEMVEEVGMMYREHLHHAKVYLASKQRDIPNRWLDRNTVDYIEAHWESILMDGLLTGAFDNDEPFTCRAGINEANIEDDPRTRAKATASSAESQDDE